MARQRDSMMLQLSLGMVMFGLLMFGLARMGYSTAAANHSVQARMDAGKLAQARIGEVRAVGFADADTTARIEEYGSVSGGERFKRVTRVTVAAPDSSVKAVRVTVFWGRDKYSCNAQALLAR